MKRTQLTILLLGISIVWVTPVQADCPLAHTHIGINPTWRPDWSDPGNPELATDSDPDDNDQLWFFSIPPVDALAPTPGWPNWGDPAEDPFLLLVPETQPGGGYIQKPFDPDHPDDPDKYLYVCRFKYSAEFGYGDPDGKSHLDGWHSAHGPQDAWNLESLDQSTVPAWEILLQREAALVATGDDTYWREDDFFMMLPGGEVVLDENGDTYQLEQRWLDDKNAWGLHEHMEFIFWLPYDPDQLSAPGPSDVYMATFTAFDAGGLYTAADPFDFSFRVTPEPVTLTLLGVALVLMRRRHRGYCR